MRKRFIYICSPCRGDVDKNIQKAQGYCREAVELFPDVVPIAPHVYCTQFLNDEIPEERAAGMDMGLALLDMCDEIWVYGLDNPSTGMAREIEYAKENGIPVRDVAEVYRDNSQPQRGKTGENWDDLGDVLLQLPSHAGSLNGVAAIESTTVRIDGELITELAKQLRRNRGQDLTVEASQ